MGKHWSASNGSEFAGRIFTLIAEDSRFSLIQECSDTNCPVKLSASMIPAERSSRAIKCQLFLIWNAGHASPAGTAGPTAA